MTTNKCALAFLKICWNYRERRRKKNSELKWCRFFNFCDRECRDSDTASYGPTKNNMKIEKCVSCWNPGSGDKESRKMNGGKGRNTCWFARGGEIERCQIRAARSRAIYHCQYLQSFSVHSKYLHVIVAVKPQRGGPNARLAENDVLSKRKRVHGGGRRSFSSSEEQPV